MADSFSTRYIDLFTRVCAFLGEGWRLDRREPQYGHQILMMNPAFKHYAISARLEKNRIHLFGNVQKYSGCGEWSSCTVSPNRQPWEIAEDIRRKILVDAKRQIALYEKERAERQQKKDDRAILIHALSQLVKAERYSFYDGHRLCSVEASNGIYGSVREGNSGFTLEVTKLSTDQLIKLVGFVSTL